MMYEQEMDNLKQAQITLTENIQRSNLAGLLSSSNEKADKINLRKSQIKKSMEAKDMNLVNLMQYQ